MTPVGIEPRTSRFGVRRSTTTPPRSHRLLQCKILSHNVIMCLVGLKPMSWLSRVCWLRDCLLPKSASNFGTEAAFPKVFFSSPGPYSIVVEPASVRPCVRQCVRPSTFSNLNISKTTRPIVIKFYLKHHRGGGNVLLGFGPGPIRTLVSMATDSSHRLTMGKT